MAHFRVVSHAQPWNDRTDVAVFIERDDGVRQVAEPLKFRDLEPGAYLDEPTVGVLPRPLGGSAFLQACLDHAWEIGMRPAGFADTTNQVAAIKGHLDDMRALVFKGVIQPKA